MKAYISAAINAGIKAGFKLATLLKLLPTANIDLIQINSISAIPTSGEVAAIALPTPGNSMIVKNKGERIRQDCDIKEISIYVSAIPSQNFTVIIWRFDGTNYDKIGEQNIQSNLTANQLNTVVINPPIAVKEGDFVGFNFMHTELIDTSILVDSSAGSILYSIADTPTETDYDWESKTAIAYSLPTKIQSNAPLIVTIGDSIIESYPHHTSMVDIAYTTVATSKSWQSKLKLYDDRFTFQNVGIGGETTTQIEARFDRDVVSIKPRFAAINGGVNDIAQGVSKAVFLAKWQSMLDKCQANGIVPIVWKIMPWTNGTNSQNMQIDTINYKIDSMITASYPTGRIIDCRPLVGEFRSGGTAGNYWDIQAAYDYDGVHFTVPGNTVIAAAIAEVDQSTAYKSNSIVHNGKTYLFPDSSGTLVTAENIVITAPGSSGDLLINDGGDIGTGGAGAMNYTTGSGLTIDNNVSIPGGVLSLFDGISNNTQVNTQTWGNNYGEAAQHWYDNGATSRSGVGQAVGELQFFIPGIFKFSFNEGGTLQTPGTNVLATIDPANDVINLNLPTFVGTGATPSSTLKVFGSFAGAITTVTANTTASISHYTILSDATSGNITITLPAASTCAGRIYIVKKIDASGNSVTIDGDSAETIDGAATVSTTTQWVSFQIQSNGANWYKLN